MMKRIRWLLPLPIIALAALALARGGLGTAGERAADGSQVRTYFIAADKVAWNYAPSGINRITGKPFDQTADVFVKAGPKRIGHVYLKTVYREYTDATFTRLKPRGPQWRHLGLLGPQIQAAVGDTIRVVFKNNLSFPASIHAHGVLYDKRGEGAPYADGTRGLGDAVAPGQRYTYAWKVPPRAGPGPMDGSSVLWMYHSHVDEVKDTNGGLVGPIIITRRGMARPDGSPKDVDREFVSYFSVIDENESRLLGQNIKHYAGKPASVDRDDEEFHESNLKHSVNGYLYGNLPGLDMRKGERVRWYVMDLGTEVDLHTPHWHGNTVITNGMRSDMAQLLPGMMLVADMRPDARGTWLFHCHVNDHITAGMLALYAVR